jgi:hypothetical protein
MDEPWFWEGNVQKCLVCHLETQGWECSMVDTVTRQRGPDIDARLNGKRMLVEVKGYPKNVYQRGPKRGQPKPTKPGLQARHWYGQALLQVLLHKADMPDTQIALAFPDLPLYDKLIARTGSSLESLSLRVYMIAEDGVVRRAL